MLILFDIDGTLLSSENAGSRTMAEAARLLFGDAFSFDGVEISGRLDPAIWDEAARANGIEEPALHHERFRETYVRLLEERFERRPTARLLPGVPELIEALKGRDDVTLGLLTGNYPESGRLKIATAGLDAGIFAVAAWGHDGVSRRDLPPVAIARLAERHGRSLRSEQVVIIGDTRHDVDCARANKCRSIGVATGTETLEDLRKAGADLAIDDLRDTDRIIGWIFAGS